VKIKVELAALVSQLGGVQLLLFLTSTQFEVVVQFTEFKTIDWDPHETWVFKVAREVATLVKSKTWQSRINPQALAVALTVAEDVVVPY